MTEADLNTILPEIVLSLYAIAALLVAVYSGKDKLAGPLIWITAALMAVLAAWIGFGEPGTHLAFGGMFVDDGFARFAKVVILVSAASVLLMSRDYMARRGML